jgi:hypothetical protein
MRLYNILLHGKSWYHRMKYIPDDESNKDKYLSRIEATNNLRNTKIEDIDGLSELLDTFKKVPYKKNMNLFEYMIGLNT